jgi:hypothetical protein
MTSLCFEEKVLELHTSQPLSLMSIFNVILEAPVQSSQHTLNVCFDDSMIVQELGKFFQEVSVSKLCML